MMTSNPSYGPLSLQVGSVTSAVEDLITGYEHIVEALPNLTEKVAVVHNGTKAMAEELEVRTIATFSNFIR